MRHQQVGDTGTDLGKGQGGEIKRASYRYSNRF